MDTFGRYLETISRWPLLTAAQEIDLGRLIQAGIKTSEQIGTRKPTSKQLKVIKTGQRSLDRMVLCNLRLVVSVAKLYTGPCKLHDIEDLIQYGSIGLKRAAEKFDPTRGYKFSTYARRWIEQEVKRGIYKTDLLVRLPEYCREDWAKVQKQKKRLTIALNRTPTTTELIQASSVNKDNFPNIARAIETATSLNAPSESGTELIDNLPDPDNRNIIAKDYGFLLDCIETLPVRDRDLINKYYGISDRPHTLKEIGITDGVTREAIRQRLVKIQNHLKLLLSEQSQ
jgi:RNA polymerase primary sigma factor